MTFNLETLKVTDGQKTLAAYINAQTGKRVKPESIALVDALRAEFRKDPSVIAERDALRVAARQRKEDTLERTLAKARKLAEELGHVVDTDNGFDEFTPVYDEVEPAPVPVPAKASSRPGPALTVVPDTDDFDESDSPVDLPAPETKDTDAIDVVEAEDGWETDEAPAGEVEDF